MFFLCYHLPTEAHPEHARIGDVPEDMLFAYDEAEEGSCLVFVHEKEEDRA